MPSSDASFNSSLDCEAEETDVEYDLEVEVLSDASEQQHTSAEDEPEDGYANEPLTDENWLAKFEAGRKKGTRTRRAATTVFTASRSKKIISLFCVDSDALLSSVWLSGAH